MIRGIMFGFGLLASITLFLMLATWLSDKGYGWVLPLVIIVACFAMFGYSIWGTVW